MNNIMNDIADLQTKYQILIDEKRLTKKAMCDLVIPFRDKYKLTDFQALQVARDELTIAEINSIIAKNQNLKGEKTMKLYAYHNSEGEIKQAEFNVKEKVILVPENDGTTFPFIYDKSIDRGKVGVPIGYSGDTIFYREPSFDMAKEIFLESERQRFASSEKDYKQKKAALEKLEKQEKKTEWVMK